MSDAATCVRFTDPETGTPCCESWLSYSPDFFWFGVEELDRLRAGAVTGDAPAMWRNAGLGPKGAIRSYRACPAHRENGTARPRPEDYRRA